MRFFSTLSDSPILSSSGTSLKATVSIPSPDLFPTHGRVMVAEGKSVAVPWPESTRLEAIRTVFRDKMAAEWDAGVVPPPAEDYTLDLLTNPPILGPSSWARLRAHEDATEKWVSIFRSGPTAEDMARTELVFATRIRAARRRRAPLVAAVEAAERILLRGVAAAFDVAMRAAMSETN